MIDDSSQLDLTPDEIPRKDAADLGGTSTELFSAAVACSLRSGKLKKKEDASESNSRLTDRTYVLVSKAGQVLQRIPLEEVKRELQKMRSVAGTGSAGPSKPESPPRSQSQSGPREYKRTCRSCGKVWHSLVSREEQIKRDEQSNNCNVCANCCNPSAQLQAKRNVEANQSELYRLKRCPECGSVNYDEIIT